MDYCRVYSNFGSVVPYGKSCRNQLINLKSISERSDIFALLVGFSCTGCQLC